MYSKGGGKNGNHACIDASTNISGVSYLALQVFQQSQLRYFTHTTDATSLLQTKQFVHLPSINLLTVISPPMVTAMGLELSEGDFEVFTQLKKIVSQLLGATKDYGKRKRGQGNELDN